MLLLQAASMIGVLPASVFDWMSKPAERDFRAVEGVSVFEAQKRDLDLEDITSRLYRIGFRRL